MLTYNEAFSAKNSFAKFKGLLTSDIFEGIVLIICGFILCFGLYDSSGGMYKILDGYQMYYQEKYFPTGLLVIIIGVGTLQIIGLPVKMGYRKRECPKNQSDYCQAVRNSQRH